MKKIIITGGLGYIGIELCKLYSGYSWRKDFEVIVTDKNFFADRVHQLNKWNIKFFQKDILNINDISEVFDDVDIIHHLAGITDVAYTKNEELDYPEKAKLIEDTAIKGTNNILKLMPNDAKIIFPSTHVIFEGIKDTIKGVTEHQSPCPILTYAKSKFQNENDILKSKKKFIILRLASVYGCSGDSTRDKIMPNLFSKKTAMDKEISLFGGGRQLKSLVNVIDVARCFKFMEEKEDINNEVFNLSNENTTVKEVALLCKKYNPSLSLKETNDEIPNLGYTLDNKKLLNTGFKFLYNLQESVKEMINLWSNQNSDIKLENITRGVKEFVDPRGKISNYELSEPVNLIGYIESKANTVRANHFHPVQEQKCLVIKGQYISIIKDLSNEKNPMITQVVNEGDLSTIKPNVFHAMVFTKDTIFLNLVRGEREHDNYGLTHTIPMQLIRDDLKDSLLEGYKFDCRCCGSVNLKRVVSFGFLPLANNLTNNEGDSFDTYPLELNYCTDCFNCQLSYVVEPKKLFDNYLYVSSTASIFRQHFKDAAIKYIKKLNLKKHEFIIDIGSNDGVALKPFLDLGYNNILGVEPAKNLSQLANSNNIRTLNSYFDKSILRKINHKASLILASNVFAHSDKVNEMTEVMKETLTSDGTIIIEVQYLINTLEDLSFDNIYHEHVNYWSLHSLKAFFENKNLHIYDVEKINTHGGSLRVYVSRKNIRKVSDQVKKILKEEVNFGIKNFSIFKDFEKKIMNIKENVNKNIINLSKKYKNMVGYGAPAKASTALNFFGISNYLQFIIEDNELKHNKFIPGTNLKILNKNDVLKNKKNIDCLLVLAWNFYEYIKSNNKNLCENFLSINDLKS
jgi:nucleoside-diphosphate-sugar epimerase/dTDP-4-dehydrorhamnose 3,5-epimerase-like enzyme